jgi:hypothetical protein
MDQKRLARQMKGHPPQRRCGLSPPSQLVYLSSRVAKGKTVTSRKTPRSRESFGSCRWKNRQNRRVECSPQSTRAARSWRGLLALGFAGARRRSNLRAVAHRVDSKEARGNCAIFARRVLSAATEVDALRAPDLWVAGVSPAEQPPEKRDPIRGDHRRGLQPGASIP